MRVLLVLLAACWSSSPQSPPVTTPRADPQPTTVAPASTEANEAPQDDDDGGTALNAKRWKFATYFNRMKRTISNNWDPSGVWKALPPVRRDSYGMQDRTTTVEISLTDRGDLVSIAIVQPSGAIELDAEAIQSVQASAPFAAPPPELLDPATSTLKFKFGFWFEIGAQKSGTSLVP